MRKQQNRTSITTSTPSTTLKEYEASAALRKTNERLAADLFAAKRQLDEARELRTENHELRQRLHALEQIDSIIPSSPPWLIKPSNKGIHHGIPTLMLSDLHFDEVVDPDEVEGVNEYNRAIALRRLKRVLAGTIEVVRVHFAGIRVDGFNLFLGGDLLSGNIHEELEQTNEDTVVGGVDYWADHLVGFISGLVEEFGKLHIAVVVGNHGRNTRKPRAKNRVRDNFDWLLCRLVARELKNDSRITWQIPESADTLVTIYNTKFRLTHGDQFRGGSGISGMMAPLMLGSYRKTMRQSTIGKPHDWLVMGHHHSYFSGKGIIVNNTLKGYDEYAYVSNFPYSAPSQAFWITTPERGMTFPCEIWAEDSRG